MSQLVQKALDFLRPHKPHRLYPIWFDRELDSSELDEIRRLLDDAPNKNDGRNIYNVVNWDGFPFHLACKAGFVHVVQLLLIHGARADLECAVCQPEEHKMITYPDQLYCLAYQEICTPVVYALSGDHEQVLRLLLHHENSKHLVKTDFLLHEACKRSSHECSKYLLQRFTEQISIENGDGRTPLQISLLLDTDSTLFLMQNGAEISDTVFITDEGTTLHELYRDKVNLGTYKATHFALEHGFRAHINKQDVDGSTALHVLLRQVGRTVKPAVQSEFDKELLKSAKLLLENGANPNKANHHGESPLHALLSDTGARQLYVTRHGQVRRLKSILQEICKVTELILEYGANPVQRSSPSFTPPLYYAIRIFQSLQPDMFVLGDVIAGLLCKEECVNVTDSYGLTPILLIFHSAYKWIGENRLNSTSSFSKTILQFLSEVLSLFLKRGLNANARLSYWTRRMDEAIESNYFKEIVLFLNLQVQDEPTYYDAVRYLLVKLIQRGGNPNLLDFRPSYGSPYTMSCEVPKDASLSFLVTRSLYIQSPATLPAVLLVFALFHKTLHQHKLYEFSSSINHFIEKEFKSIQLDEPTISYIHNLTNSPRRLKDSCRRQMAECVGWRLSYKRCARLPLPKVLLQYATNFDI